MYLYIVDVVKCKLFWSKVQNMIKGRFKPSQHVGQHVPTFGGMLANMLRSFIHHVLGHIFIYIWYFVETKQMRVVYLI